MDGNDLKPSSCLSRKNEIVGDWGGVFTTYKVPGRVSKIKTLCREPYRL